MFHVITLVVPAKVVLAAIGQLGDEYRRAAPGEEQQREARGDGLDVVVWAVTSSAHHVGVPRAVGPLGLDQPAAADLVPVVAAEVTLAGNAAGAFDAVEAVEGRAED